MFSFAKTFVLGLLGLVVLAPLALLLTLVFGVPAIVVLGVLAVPFVAVLAVIGLPFLLIAALAMAVIGVLFGILGAAIAVAKLLLVIVLPVLAIGWLLSRLFGTRSHTSDFV